MRSKYELAEARKPVELDFLNRFLYAHKLPFRPDLSVVSNLLSYSEKYRVLCDEQGDIDALYEFIALCGEQALTAKWVLNRIHHARWWLSPDVLLWAKDFAVKNHCPPDTYLFYLNELPISEEQAQAFVAATQDVARDILYRIGRALANVQGSGRPSGEKTEEETRQSDRERKRDFDRQERMARGKLRQAIEVQRRRLPRAVSSDPRRRQEAIREITNRVLNPYLVSKKAPERKAAEKVKRQLDRELSRLNM